MVSLTGFTSWLVLLAFNSYRQGCSCVTSARASAKLMSLKPQARPHASAQLSTYFWIGKHLCYNTTAECFPQAQVHAHAHAQAQAQAQVQAQAHVQTQAQVQAQAQVRANTCLANTFVDALHRGVISWRMKSRRLRLVGFLFTNASSNSFL
jgi:UDP-3-O-[3-hydroxymyristoyl] glucosamine N-acyltransferase